MTLTLAASSAPYEPETQCRQTNKKKRDKDADDVHPRSRETCKDEEADSSDSHRQYDKPVDDGTAFAWATSGEQHVGDEFKEVAHIIQCGRSESNAKTHSRRASEP